MQIIDYLSQGLYLAVILSALPLLSSLLIGLVVSVFQAATQIQESTLSFVPKLVVVACLLYFFGAWMSSQLIDYTINLIESFAVL